MKRDKLTLPLPLGRVEGDTRPCACGCGALCTGKARYFKARCRKAAQRARDAAEAGRRVEGYFYI